MAVLDYAPKWFTKSRVIFGNLRETGCLVSGTMIQQFSTGFQHRNKLPGSLSELSLTVPLQNGPTTDGMMSEEMYMAF